MGLGGQVTSSSNLITSKIEIVMTFLLYHWIALKSPWDLTVGHSSWQGSLRGSTGCLCPSVLLERERELPADPQVLTGKSWKEDGNPAKVSPIWNRLQLTFSQLSQELRSESWTRLSRNTSVVDWAPRGSRQAPPHLTMPTACSPSPGSGSSAPSSSVFQLGADEWAPRGS